MTVVDQAERVVEKHVGLPPPWREPLPRRALEYCLKNIIAIQEFKALGMTLITEVARRELILKYLGAFDPLKHEIEDYNFNVWLANECIGKVTPARHIFLRCTGCNTLRCNRSIEDRICKCGGSRMTGEVPSDLNTKMAMRALLLNR